MRPTYVIGGHQTDFARNFAREGVELFDVIGETVGETLERLETSPREVTSIHVGNAFGELFLGQGHLAGAVATVLPELRGVPAVRYEAACASGSMAIYGAMAAIESGRSELALVVGAEQQRNVPPQLAAKNQGAAAWVGHEAEDAEFLWPHMFSLVAKAYEARYGLDYGHLGAIAKKNIENARDNPYAQTRGRTYEDEDFGTESPRNPRVAGMLRRQDCAHFTDGVAVALLASRDKRDELRRRGSVLSDALIEGWGHRTACLPIGPKLDQAPAGDSEHLLDEVRHAITDAYTRAGVAGPTDLDAIETHDCFTITEYMAIDHFGLTPPGKAWQAIEDGVVYRGGQCPVNPSGGLIGGGHPVGATGVRMLLDAARQVTEQAGATQIDGARRVACLNIGGSATTVACTIVVHPDHAVGSTR